MPVAISVFLILIITGVIYFLNKILLARLGSLQAFKVCPICAGVAATWILILIGVYTGILEASEWLIFALISMGGSVVGIAFQFQKRFNWAGEKGLIFKTLIILAGFPLAYLAINNISVAAILVEIALLAILAYILFIKNNFGVNRREISADLREKEISELEKKLENCCD
ncbi:hypothetical protein HY227_01835 [Candidatus Wolfebacteria bacterium]|nr:hypothetical protein [Candidatus Wolfebacteria bacterium]